MVVYSGGRPIEVWRAPMTLCPGPATLVAADDLALTALPASVEDRAAALAEQNARLWARIDADARRDDDTFLDGARPVPGPWHFRSVQALILAVEGTTPTPPRGMRRAGSRYALAIARFEGCGSEDPRDTSRFAYHEVTPFVPVWTRRGPSAWVPELYCDAWMAMVLGREIHGFPKRTARIGFHEDGAELLVDRRMALRVRFDGRRGANPAEVMGQIAATVSGRRVGRPIASVCRRFADKLALSVLVHKRIGDPRTAGRTLSVDQVVRVPMKLDRVRSASHLHGLRVDMEGGGCLQGRVLAGWEVHSGFRFGEGRVFRRRASR